MGAERNEGSSGPWWIIWNKLLHNCMHGKASRLCTEADCQCRTAVAHFPARSRAELGEGQEQELIRA